MYGSGDRQHRFRPYLQRMFDRQPIILVEEEQACWQFAHGYVENVAAAIALAVRDNRAAGQIYNLSEPVTPTLFERIQRLGNVVGWGGKMVILPKMEVLEPLELGDSEALLRSPLASPLGRSADRIVQTAKEAIALYTKG